MTKVNSVHELKDRASSIIGIPFHKIDETGRLTTGKGAVGTMIEESWFGQKPHSDDKPDFADFGIELKATPYLVNKGYKSKERLVCNMINYMKEHENNTFEESSFYKKCNSILMMFYEHKENKTKDTFFVSHVKFMTLSQMMKTENLFFYLLPQEDIEMMRQDWKVISSKIKNGEAHLISEGDTNYLGACTKASDSKKRVKQPFSLEPAKPRAFSIKQSYMTYVLNNYVMGQLTHEKLVHNIEELKEKNFEEIVTDKISPFYGRTDVEIAQELGISTKDKGFRNKIIAKILDIKGNVNDSEEFQKANITLKAIRVEKSGNIKESMSFPTIDFHKMMNDEWEDSEFYNCIGTSKFMFAIFNKDGANYRLKEVKFWNMPVEDIDEAKIVWEHTKELIINDKAIIGGRHGFSVENFPKSSENEVSHVRPHDANLSKGRITLPNGTKIANYCFWLNRKYLVKITR